MLLKALQVLGWKKVKLNQVSDNFQRVKEYVILILEELEHITIDIMLLEIDSIDVENENLALEIAINYEKRLSKETKWEENNVGRKAILNFVRIAHRFTTVLVASLSTHPMEIVTELLVK